MPTTGGHASSQSGTCIPSAPLGRMIPFFFPFHSRWVTAHCDSKTQLSHPDSSLAQPCSLILLCPLPTPGTLLNSKGPSQPMQL